MAPVADFDRDEAVRLYATGEWSLRALGRRYGVHHFTIRKLVLDGYKPDPVPPVPLSVRVVPPAQVTVKDDFIGALAAALTDLLGDGPFPVESSVAVRRARRMLAELDEWRAAEMKHRAAMRGIARTPLPWQEERAA